MEDVRQYAKGVAMAAIQGNLTLLPITISGNLQRADVFKQTFLEEIKNEMIRIQNDIYMKLHKEDNPTGLGNLNFQLLYLRTVYSLIGAAQ